jgi:hypothetical protein
MANTNAPYGFRLWSRLAGGNGALPLSPALLRVPSAATLKVGDPIKSSAGLGYLAVGTNAIYGVLDSPVPGWSEVATAYHYPDIIPADDQSVWRVQSIGTVNVTNGYMGVPSRKYRIGGTTSGYSGIDLSHWTGGVLQVIGLAPGSALGTYAELLVMIARGAFYGAA